MINKIHIDAIMNDEAILEEIIKDIKNGRVFIYPTDTIYGIGCNALNIESVERIKKIKERDEDKPLSVIAPSTLWIEENLNMSDEDKKMIEKCLPGAFTILLKKKENDFFNHVSKNERLGVRIPKCRFFEIIEKAGVPFITTSVNISGEPFALNLNDIKENIIHDVDYVIETQEKLSGVPSTIICDGKEIKRN